MRKSLLFAALLPLSLKPFAQNVGIGTGSPSMKLHVSHNDSAIALLENTTTLAAGKSAAMYFKVGNYYTGAIKTTGAGAALSALSFYTFGTVNQNNLRERMTILDNGNIGIGLTDPAYLLDLNNRMRIRHNGGNSAGIWYNKADNSDEACFMGNYNDSIFGLYTNYGGGWQFFFNHKSKNLGIDNSNPKVGISFPASFGKKISLYPGGSGDVGMGVYGNEFRLHSDYSGADITFGYDQYATGFVERMRVKGNGSVCIGTTSPAAGYLLSVGGKIISEEVRVQLEASWPDYVFAHDYKLPQLSHVKEFIAQNKHLPDIPPASVIEKNGLDVGDMQKRMMEKIEQLTLYVIDLQEQITDLKAKLNEKK